MSIKITCKSQKLSFVFIIIGLSIIFNLLPMYDASAQSPDWVWAVSAGGTGSDSGNSIDVDTHGNIYVTGSFSSSTITFGTTTLINAGDNDIFIVKYDSLGNVLWAKCAGGTDSDIGRSIGVDIYGNCYVTGSYSSPTLILDTITLQNYGSGDIFIVKYDSLGNLLWAKNAIGSSNDYPMDITLDQYGNSYITGAFWSPTLTFGSNTLINTYSYDIFIVKFNPSGNALWAKSAGGSSYDFSNSICVDNNGNSYITGYYLSDTISFDSLNLTNNSTSYNIFLAKYNSTGNIEWVKKAGNSSNNYGKSIACDTNGNCYITGSYLGSPITFGSINLINYGGEDVFVVKYDSSGNVLWAKNAIGTFDDAGKSISVDLNGNCYVSGYFRSYSIKFGSITVTNVDYKDIFVVKYNSLGNALWAKSAGGVGYEEGYSNSVSNNGELLLTGYFNSPMITFANTTLVGNSSSNVFVSKISNQITNLSEFDKNLVINIFPNPANKYIYIDYNKPFALEIYTLSGKKIIESTKSQIDISKLSSATYMVVIKNKYDIIIKTDKITIL